MAPNTIGSTFLLAETTIKESKSKQTVSDSLIEEVNNNIPLDYTTNNFIENEIEIKSNLKIKNNDIYKVEIVWGNVIAFILLHLAALYGVYILFSEGIWHVYLFGHLLGLCGGFGVTGGAHRLWSHRSYKAKWPMRLVLMIFQTLAFQNCIYEWVRDHRVHHKFTDTNADPHNSRRGFFFSHMGWLMCKKHPDVRTKGKTIDMSDLEADSIVMFQKRYYLILMPLLCFVIPALIPALFMNASFRQGFFVSAVLRYVITLHITWFVNSAAHIWGYKPYDKNINPTDNRFVIFIASGEGYHNYHHIFPWDYKAAELGSYFFNLTKNVIDLCSKIGWAYDLKTVSVEMIRKRIVRTGDGTHNISLIHKKTEELLMQLDHEKEEQMIWGWDDKDMSEIDKKDAFIINKN